MIQVLQDLRHGETKTAEVPAPLVQPGHLLIANERSLLSPGTEKAAIELTQKSLLGKARERPDHVRRVLKNVREEGVFETWRKVNAKLDEPMTMGYSSTGVVLACGDGVQDYKPGDRVASNGPHAEVVCVPKHLCARVPDSVHSDQAAFTVLGAIAMQGVRLSKVTLGETVLVVGLGLVGQLAVALLKAAGCRVVATDLETSRCQSAVKMGADISRPNLKASDVEQLTGGLGADAVLIAAAAKTDTPIQLASQAVRQKGRIVLVGVADLHFDRRPMYFKEAEFVVSCSYGPGRYDADYEQRGHDYPAAHVRWTEQRNLQAVLDLMGHGQLDVSPLISHRFPIQQAEEAYRLIEEDSEPYMGILLEYAKSRESRDESRELGEGGERRAESGEQKEGRKGAKVLIENRKSKIENDKIGVGVFGAGNFAKMVLIPKIAANSQMNSIGVCSAKGVSATHVGSKHGFQWATTDERDVFDDPNVDAVFLITRHDQHARHVLQALKAGKHVFVEKPLCLSVEELLAIEEVLAERARYEVRGASKEVRGQRPEARRQRSEVRDSQPSTLNSQPSRVIENQKSKIENPILMVGFNRRFSPTAKLVREFFSDTGAKKGSGTDCAKHPQDRSGKRFLTPLSPLTPFSPLTVSIRFNAGAVSAEHWTQNGEEGGGRIIGEACHGIDLASYLVGAPPVRVFAESIGHGASETTDDQCFITLRHANGSVSNIAYLAGGDKAFPKERIEVIGGGRIAVIDDFRSVTTCTGGKTRRRKLRRQDKGHSAEIEAFAHAVTNSGPWPIPWSDLRAVALASILAVQSLREGVPFEVPGGNDE